MMSFSIADSGNLFDRHSKANRQKYPIMWKFGADVVEKGDAQRRMSEIRAAASASRNAGWVQHLDGQQQPAVCWRNSDKPKWQSE